MPNDFIGDLSKSSFLELVGPLLNGKKSGMVRIKGDRDAELYLEAGRVTHATTEYSEGEEAILNLMEWHSGRVTFDWEATTDERNVVMPAEQLLLSWANRENEWQKIREFIPSPALTFKMSLDGPHGDRNIPGDQWKVLVMCNGERTVLETAETLNWSEFRTSKLLYEMLNEGLITKSTERANEPKVETRRYVNGNFFPYVEIELKRIMGPIATFIIEDKISDFGESREAFREDLVSPLLQSLAEEISDDTKRASFTRTMAELVAQKLR
jgi:hypothetical protein